MNQEYARHAKATLWSAVGLLPGQLRGIILIPILTKILGIRFYGEYVLVLTLISLVSGVSDLGLGASLSRFLPSVKDTDEGAKVFYTIFWSTVVINSVIFFALGVACTFLFPYMHLQSNLAFHFSAVVALYSTYGVVLEFYRAHELARAYTLVGGAKSLVEILAIGIVAIISKKLIAVIDGMAIINFVALAIILVSIRTLAGDVYPPDARLKRFLAFSLPLVPGRVANWAVALSDRFLIGILLGEFAVGVYNPGYALGSMIIVVPTIIVTMLPPLLSRLYDAGDVTTMEDLVVYSLKYFFIFGVPVFFGLLVISKQVLELLSTRTIAEGAFMIAPIVAAGSLMYGSTYILLQMLQVKLQTKKIAAATLTGAIVNVILNLLFLKQFGIIAAAVTTMIAFGITFAMVLSWTNMSLGYIVKRTRLLKISLSSLAMALVLVFLNVNYHNKIVASVIGVTFSYPLFAILFGVADQRERRLLSQVIKRFPFAAK